MTIAHIVLLQFAPTADPEAIKKLCAATLGLRTGFLHPKTQKPFILSVRVGKDCSPEGHQGGFTHGFVIEFENAADRDTYLREPPGSLGMDRYDELVQEDRVVDVENGVF